MLILRSIQISLLLHLCDVALSTHRISHHKQNIRALNDATFDAKIAEEMVPAGIEFLTHFRGSISFIIEQKKIYTEAASELSHELRVNHNNHYLHSWTYLESGNYTYPESFGQVQSAVHAACEHVEVVVLLMDVRMAKECLIAAHDLPRGMGNRTFVVFQVDLDDALGYEREPYRWSTTDFLSLTTHASSLKKLISRNRKLCAMWEKVYTLMITLPRHFSSKPQFLQTFDVSDNMEDISLRHVAGKRVALSRVGTHHVFIKRPHSTNSKRNEGRLIYYPFAVYRYGSREHNATRRCINMLSKRYHRHHKYRFPQMRKIAHFQVTSHSNDKREWELRLVSNVTFSEPYTPEIAVCGFFPGSGGSGGTFRLIESVFVIAGFVLLVLVSIVVYQEMTKTRIEHDFMNGPAKKLIDAKESKAPVQV